MKKETTLPVNYLVDKWYFQKKDPTKKFYEKYFYEKEIEKMRIKNYNEKLAAQGGEKTGPTKVSRQVDGKK